MNDEECAHGLMPDWCSNCKHGPDVPGWGDGKPKRRRIPPRPERNWRAEISGMIGVDPRWRSANPNGRAVTPDLAPRSSDNRRPPKAVTPGGYRDPRPWPRGGAKRPPGRG